MGVFGEEGLKHHQGSKIALQPLESFRQIDPQKPVRGVEGQHVKVGIVVLLESKALDLPRGMLLPRRMKRAIAGQARQKSPRALSQNEVDAVLAELHSERFIDASPEHIYATLLDEGRYLCSVRTFSTQPAKQEILWQDLVPKLFRSWQIFY